MSWLPLWAFGCYSTRNPLRDCIEHLRIILPWGKNTEICIHQLPSLIGRGFADLCASAGVAEVRDWLGHPGHLIIQRFLCAEGSLVGTDRRQTDRLVSLHFIQRHCVVTGIFGTRELPTDSSTSPGYLQTNDWDPTMCEVARLLCHQLGAPLPGTQTSGTHSPLLCLISSPMHWT